MCVLQEMASAELKQIREALTKESIREHQLSKVGGTETDMFICSKCHGKSCTYTQVRVHLQADRPLFSHWSSPPRSCVQVQTRSADEPMTTFVLCNSCGNRWKVTLYLTSDRTSNKHRTNEMAFILNVGEVVYHSADCKVLDVF